ncbi:MAG: hypothetical protein FWF72_07010 [Paludibacter sp.]|nr:hypothetical protein [Paludibacter sp.]
MKKIIIGITILLTVFSVNAQVGIQLPNPRPNTVIEIQTHDADMQGVQLPHSVQNKITLQDEVVIGPSNSVAINNDGLLFYEESSSCFRYYNLPKDQWWSLCGTPPPADAELQNCYQAKAAGTYLEKATLTISNYLQIPVHVNSAGTYTITSVVKNAANNEETYYFTTNGTFPNAGNFVVNVPGAGMPTTSGNHIVNISINGVVQSCDIPVTVMPRDPDYIILDVEQLNPNWNILTPLADGTYKVAVKLLVYNPGTWGLTTSEVNGYTFAATGEISGAQGFNPDAPFPQTITVLVPVAAGQALVYGTGVDRFLMSTTTSKTASNRDFNILLTKGGFKLDRVNCFDSNMIVHMSSSTAMSSTDILSDGTYFVSDAYIKIPIVVIAPGQYVVYADVAGARFATCTLQGSAYVINPVTLTSSTNTLTLYPVGALDNSNPMRLPRTSVYNTDLPIIFSAGDINGPDGIVGNSDDWQPESGYFQEDEFCKPSVKVMASVARFADLRLAPQAPTSGSSAYSNGMRYHYSTTLGNQVQARLNAATQGVYTVDYAGNTPVTGINLEAQYSVAGSYNFIVTFGHGADTIAYTAKGELPPLASGQLSATATITLTPFKKDNNGNFVDAGGNVTTNPAQYVWNTKDGNQLPATIEIGRSSDIIDYYRASDNPGSGVMTGHLEVPLWFGYRAMKVVSLGGISFSLNETNSVGNRLLTNQNIFGYQGIVPVGGINLVQSTTLFPLTAAGITAYKNAIRDADVVLVQYNGGDQNSSNYFAQVFKDFIDMGGALMYSCQNQTSTNGVMNAIYNTSGITSGPGVGLRYGIVQQQGTPAYANNPILNGPFTKDSVNVIAVGNDQTTGVSVIVDAIFNAAAPNAVVLALAAANRAFMFYDPSKGFLFCGDSGWLASSSWNNTSTTGYPFVTYNNTWMPRPKSNYGAGNGSNYPTGNGLVYNSHIFSNYMAFALEYAAAHRDHTRDATW